MDTLKAINRIQKQGFVPLYGREFQSKGQIALLTLTVCNSILIPQGFSVSRYHKALQLLKKTTKISIFKKGRKLVHTLLALIYIALSVSAFLIRCSVPDGL